MTARADAELPSETVCIIHPDNAASVRVANKCGYVAVRRTTYGEQPVILLQRNKGS